MADAPTPLRPHTTTKNRTAQIVAVRIEPGGESALAAVLVRLADSGGLVIVQAVPTAARGRATHELLMALRAELPRSDPVLLVLLGAPAELTTIVRLRGKRVIALVGVETADPVPAALAVRDALDADEIVLAEQSAAGLVLERIKPGHSAAQEPPCEELPA